MSDNAKLDSIRKLLQEFNALESAGAGKPGHPENSRRNDLLDELQDAAGLAGKMVMERDILRKAELLFAQRLAVASILFGFHSKRIVFKVQRKRGDCVNPVLVRSRDGGSGIYPVDHTTFSLTVQLHIVSQKRDAIVPQRNIRAWLGDDHHVIEHSDFVAGLNTHHRIVQVTICSPRSRARVLIRQDGDTAVGDGNNQQSIICKRN